MFYYEYEIIGSMKIDEEFENYHDTGILAAKNYADAVRQLVAYYGEDTIDKMVLDIFSDAPLKIDKKTLNKMREKVIW